MKIDPLAPVRWFDRLQRRHAPLAIVVAVLRTFSDQGAGNAAALMAWWAFFSIFPLLLLFVTILGYVLSGDPAAQRSIEHSVLQQFPILGQHTSDLHGSGVALVVGLLGTLWSGLGVTVAAQNAFNTVYMVPHRERPDFFVSRLRGLKLLVTVGVLQVVSSVASGLVTGGLGGSALVAAGIIASLALNLVLFTVVFRFLTAGAVPTRELWPGIVLASCGWEVLQALGGIYVAHVVKGATQAYGTFATVIGLLAWLYLGARVVVYAAEFNVVLTRRLWPRSIMDPPEPADRRARAALAKVEERDDKETVEVAFHPPAPDDAQSPEHPPYAVAPEPEPGERAQPVSEDVATPDIHTLTVEELLDAIAGSLDDVDADPASRRRARELLDAARAGMADGDGVAALAEATRRALGLAPTPPPADGARAAPPRSP